MQLNTDAYRFLSTDKNVGYEDAGTVILPAPLETDEIFNSGVGEGVAAVLKASKKLELWDAELGKNTSKIGIATVQELHFSDDDPEWAVAMIRSKVSEIAGAKKKVIVLGGEHTITAGSIQGMKAVYPKLSVLHLDAHADLQEQTNGHDFGPASLLTRVQECCPFVSVGVRSMTENEAGMIDKKMLPVWTMSQIREDPKWMDSVLGKFNEPVYLSLNVDVLDPSAVPNVNRPEPDGFSYRELLRFLRRIFQELDVIGFDISGLCPSAGPIYGVHATAKLIYRMIGYWSD